MQAILRVSNLKLDLAVTGSQPKCILKDISFSLPKGSLTGFIGLNGAGKTTTIKALLNFIHPTSGEIEFFGELGLSSITRTKIGFLPERPYFYDFLTGIEFLTLHWQLRGLAIDHTFKQRVDEVLKEVDLERGRHLRLRQFSKGMLQRIGIAQAIIHQPELLILDEPMSGLDPDGRILIKQIIRNLNARGTTIFFSSHLLQDMEELCNRLVIIDKGHTIYEGSLLDLGAKGSNQFRIIHRSTKDRKEKEILCPSQDLQKKIDELRQQGEEILLLQPQKISLDDAFVLLRQKQGG